MLRIVSLVMLLAAMFAITIKIIAPSLFPGVSVPFFWLWLALFGLYFLACLVLLLTKPGRGRWWEWGLILFGALLLRAVLVPLPPIGKLSPDAWRYVWDARVTLFGYSPYVSPPDSPQFAGLHDFLFDAIGYVHVPTIYPPAAQAFYIVSYLLSPSNLYLLKGIFVGCDLLSCGLIMVLLWRRGLDPARVLLYAWCPLTIVEIGLQGHLDALPVLFSLLTALSALGTSMRWGRRAWTGVWLAVTTLTRLYPLVYIAAVWRKHDRVVPLVCVLAIVLSYVPYVILGQGAVLGFFSTYMGEQGANGGPLRVLLNWLNDQLYLSGPVRTVEIDIMLGSALAGMALMVWLLRQKERISVEAGLLLVTGAIFLVSPHIYPWYTVALLPWVAILVRPLWSRGTGLNVAGMVVAAAWYLSNMSIMSYHVVGLSWLQYQWLVYSPVWLVLLLAAGKVLAAHGWLRLPAWAVARIAARRFPLPAENDLDERSVKAETERIGREEVSKGKIEEEIEAH